MRTSSASPSEPSHLQQPAGADRPRRFDTRTKALRRFALSITIFNIVGHLLLGFEQAYLTPVVGVLTGYAMELLLETVSARATGRRARYLGGPTALVDFLLPAHIAGLACAMLLYGNESLWPTAFAVSVAVASKYVVRIRIDGVLRHVLNPSNLGISVTLILFTWVSIAPPYHFTANVYGFWDWAIPLGIGMAGTMLNGKLTRRMPLILGWVGGFVLQAVLRAVLFDASLPAALLPMAGVAFILFTNYMITDPGTTPTTPRRQVLFGLATALTYGALVLAHITFGFFFALVIVCAVRGLLIVTRNRLTSRRGSATTPTAADPVPATSTAPESAAQRAEASAGLIR